MAELQYTKGNIMFVATINVPGYLPMDDEPAMFYTAREAWQYLVGEVDRSWDDFPEDENGASVDAHTQLHNLNQDEVGTVHAPTPGYDGDHDLGLAYSVTEVHLTHVWHKGWMTGAVTCEVCGLLPLDEEDTDSECPGSRDL